MTGSDPAALPALQPGISVIIPVRDDAGPLRRCLAALAHQTRPPQEILVVDNGSGDDLGAVARAARERFGLPLRVLHEPRPGVAFATQTGYSGAAHEIIARCDADSIPPAHWLACLEQELSTPLRGGRRLVAVTGGGRFTPGPLLLGRALGALYLGLYGAASGLALAHAPLWGSNMALRTDWWREIAPHLEPRPGIHDDFDLSFELRPHESIAVARGIVMPVSWRAAISPRRLVGQQRMAGRLLRQRWRQEPPWARHRRRWAGRRTAGAAGDEPVRGGA